MISSTEASPDRIRGGWLRRFLPVGATYLVATWLTNAHFMADTADYVDSIAARFNGVDYQFWEFGHVLWRPLGWLLTAAGAPLFDAMGESNTRIQITLVLVALSWIAGLLSVLMLRAWLGVLVERGWLADFVTVGFILSHGFLNCSQTGTSYIPGLALLLVGLYALALGGVGYKPTVAGVVAGLALAGSVLLWFLYVWAIPAALVSPLILFGAGRQQRRVVVLAAATFTGATGLVYAVVVFGLLGISSVAGLQAWVSAASHGVNISGLSRMVFGLSRSFINMGNDGMLFKRFLVHDPLNPISLAEILRLSLWKFVLFYLALLATVICLLRSRQGLRALGVFVVAAAPVFIFAVLFDGGAIERYLPLYPFVFMALAVGLDRAWPERASDRPPDEPDLAAKPPSRRSARLSFAAAAVAATFVVVAAAVNVGAMAKRTLDRQQEAVAERIAELLPRLTPGSRVVVVHWQDDLVNFNRSFPFNKINRDGDLPYYSLLTLGTSQVDAWRKDFATLALSTWSAGGEVWISKRALNARPLSEWNWVEGSDERVSWSDVHDFFKQFALSDPVGGEDGFVRLARDPQNHDRLVSIGESGQEKIGVAGRTN